MLTLKDHITFLVDNYNLNNLYLEYKIMSISASICNQLIYWSILIFSIIILSYPYKIKPFILCTFILLIIQITLTRYSYQLRDEMSAKLVISNTTFFSDRLKKFSKKALLNINLSEYYKNIRDINVFFKMYLGKERLKICLPIIFIRFIIISYKLKDPVILILGLIYNMYINYLYSSIYSKTNVEINKIRKLDSILGNYIYNSKNLLINNNYNNDYINNKSLTYENHAIKLDKIINSVYYYSNIGNFVFILIIIYLNIKKINSKTYYYYLMIIYDILQIEATNHEYYLANAKCSTIDNTIISMFKYKQEKEINLNNKVKINQIIINEIRNKEPKIIINNKIIINSNDNILLEGSSGSGKTSLLYILAGIQEADYINVEPNINHITQQTFISLPNYKGLYSGNLYDIISNYNPNPDINLINNAIKLSKYNQHENIYINTNDISAGEHMRLLIAHIIYTVTNNDNYNILCFDEIDNNLEDALAYEICNELTTVFRDKLIIYITHNETVKKIFSKKIVVKNGTFTCNF